ncbi:hypothetical protein [Micromonospora sp. CPCC 206061]|uniref:hypothetical protein n=1 Tax=Micromonospora sp. CPCC 206061 TaxID=3122410 RepID=UPI002FEFC014
MSDPTTPDARVRPGSVTISSYLLYLCAAIGVIGAVTQLATIGTVSDVYTEAYEGTTAEGTEGIATASVVVASVLGLLFAAGFVVLGILNSRGKNVSRIVTWVVGGISLCCTGFGIVGTAASSSLNMSTGDGPDPAEIQDRINSELPWLTPLSLTTSVITLVALLVALILLALPPSNEFFRKPTQAWEPPVPGGAYPAYPQVPPAGPSPYAPPATDAAPPSPSTPPSAGDATAPPAQPPSENRPSDPPSPPPAV